MAEGVGYYFKVPSLDKVPVTYDDEVNELESEYKLLAEQLGESENIRNQSIQQLREWISKNAAIKRCRTDAPFLLRFLRTNKYSFLRTVKMLENYLRALVIHKNWFGDLDVDEPELSALIDGGYLFSLPKLDAKGRIVYFSFSSGFDLKRSSIASAIKMNHFMGEVYFDTNEAQCAGIVCIYDMEKIDMSVLGQISLQDVRTLVELLNNTSVGRFQELHFVNAQKVTRTFANMVLQLMSEKIRSRVFCHPSIASLHAQVDKSLLPKEFGGSVPASEMIAKFKEICRQMRPRLQALDGMEIDVKQDAIDAWKDNSHGIGGGVIGSFRKLEVD
ncbi:hypothetical protein RP20_CCG012212 [Aedes albopictus]|nr:hypothetical protein RP20_CCG012212 [Aedes albopictus]